MEVHCAAVREKPGKMSIEKMSIEEPGKSALEASSAL